MHKSNNPNNFRNEKYLNECEDNCKSMIRSYHKFVSYKNKLENELTMTDDQRNRLEKVKNIMKKNIRRIHDIIEKDD